MITLFDLQPRIMGGWPLNIPELVPTPSQYVPPTCFCGSPTVYSDSAVLYGGTSHGMRWICSRFPSCRGSVGAHPDGAPLGTVADHNLAQLRTLVHRLLDPLWRLGPASGKNRHRAATYSWLAKQVGLPANETHIGKFTVEQCEKALDVLEGRYRQLGKPFPKGYFPQS